MLTQPVRRVLPAEFANGLFCILVELRMLPELISIWSKSGHTAKQHASSTISEATLPSVSLTPDLFNLSYIQCILDLCWQGPFEHTFLITLGILKVPVKDLRLCLHVINRRQLLHSWNGKLKSTSTVTHKDWTNLCIGCAGCLIWGEKKVCFF